MKFFTVKLKTILIIALALVIGAVAIVFSYKKFNDHKQSSAGLALTIVIDAGHGGIDGGAVGKVTGAKESDINLAISKKLETYLKKYNVRVVQTRTNKDGLYKKFGRGYKKEDMGARKKIIEENSPDLVVSIHQNSFPSKTARGANIYYNDLSESGKKVADLIVNEFKNIEDCKSAKTSTGDLYMLYCTEAPSVLVECGFLSNAEDEALLVSSLYQDRIAYAIFCAIAKYFEFIAY